MSKFEQGSPEWLEERKRTIGASDVPIILGLSPYTTPYELWEVKMGYREVKNSFQMDWGHQNEEPARQRYNEATGYNVAPAVICHPSILWLRASFDGISFDGKHGCEIKSNGPNIHAAIKNDPSKIPLSHVIQMRVQWECGLSLETLDYVSDNGMEAVIVSTERNRAWFDSIVPELEAFYKCMIDKTPPAFNDRDVIERDDDQNWCDFMRVYCALDSVIKELQVQQDYVKNELITIAGDNSAHGGGGKLTRYYRQGNVDYGKIDALKDVDLEQYRKKGSWNWRITKDSDNGDSA